MPLNEVDEYARNDDKTTTQLAKRFENRCWRTAVGNVGKDKLS